MRIIAARTLRNYWRKFPTAKQSLLAWYEDVGDVDWETPQELKWQYRNASILTDKRVVFNIHGNSFRLIVDIEYRLKIVFVVWFGTHREYDKINAKTISYDKAHKR